MEEEDDDDESSKDWWTKYFLSYEKLIENTKGNNQFLHTFILAMKFLNLFYSCDDQTVCCYR
jgi:hypothetical protein